MSRLALALALGAGLCLAGCGDGNLLQGSLSEVFPLDVSRVEVYRNTEALQMTYLFNHGLFLDVVIQVAVSLQDVELKPGARIVLAGDYTPGHPRTTVAHAPGGEPVRLLPPLKKGDLVITAGGEPGQVTRGNFSMQFETTGGDIGFGRTLNGNFVGTAVDAGFGDLP